MYDRQRATGVMLHVLDTEALCRAVAAQAGSGPLEVGFGPFAAAQTADGLLAVICAEGVGWEVTGSQPLALDLYAKVEGAISVVPSLIANLTAEEVSQYITEETVDLATLVRKFGGRLEDNFWLWHARLAGALC